MKHITMTPFGRHPVAADLSAQQALANAPCPALPIDKWAVLRELITARHAFGVSDRDLAVLHALISFLPGTEIGAETQTIVFPSNARLGERAHGMPESTLRRHIAALVAAGLILRHDSPNGKRFARKDGSGQIARAFGFDLRPLLIRAEAIAQAAETARRTAEEMREQREEVVLRLRDLGPDAPQDLHRLLRRKQSLTSLRELNDRIKALQATDETPATTNSSANPSRNERHIQDSNKTPIESEQEAEKIQLATVTEACPSAADYSTSGIATWHQLIQTAAAICPMMGIAAETWGFAARKIGPVAAAISVLCILEQFDRIKNPGAYLRSLSSQTGFRILPMLNAQLARRKLTAVNHAALP